MSGYLTTAWTGLGIDSRALRSRSPASDSDMSSDDAPSSGCHPEQSPSTKSHARKKPEGHIPRPRNAFIIFRSNFVQTNRVPASIEKNHQNISRIAGKIWRAMSNDEKRPWFARAEEEKVEHARLYPAYRYSPTTDVAALGDRRRVKKGRGEDELRAQDQRCAEVATLLAEGRSGNALEKAVKELETGTVFPPRQESLKNHAVPQTSNPNPRIDPHSYHTATAMHIPFPNSLGGIGAELNDLQLMSSKLYYPLPSLQKFDHPGCAIPIDQASSCRGSEFPAAHAHSPLPDTLGPNTDAQMPSIISSPRGPNPSSALRNALPSKVCMYGDSLPSPHKQPRESDGRWFLREMTRQDPGGYKKMENHDDSD